MGALQKAIARAMTRLGDITLSQKIALLLGGLLVAVSLVWLAQWAASPEMVALLPQDFSAEELATLQSGLEALGEDSEIRGQRIYVSAGANRQMLLARLHEEDRLPGNTSAGFASLVHESNPWISQAENERRWIVALQSEIEGVLRQFQGVKSARVFVPLNTSRARFAKNEAPKSASVTLTMKSGPVPRELALAAARLVSGAVKGLALQNVQVVDANGGPALDWSAEQNPSNQLSRRLAEVERLYAERIRRVVAADPKALVSVHPELDTTTRSVQTAQPVKGEVLVEEVETENMRRTHPEESPGVQANTGLAVTGAGRTEEQTKSRTHTDYQPGQSTTLEETPAGNVKQVTAVVSLSYSYLESLYRHEHADAEAPTDAQIEEVFQRERERLVPQLALLVTPQNESNVAISRYFDGALDTALAGSGDTLNETLNLVQTYGPQSGLALLALVSLGLMLRLARKSEDGDAFGLEIGLPRDAIDAVKMAASDIETVTVRRAHGAAASGASGRAADAGTHASPHAGAAYVGDATHTDVQHVAATEGVLVAQEVDSATVQTRKMLDQITEMVEGDTEAVAHLVEQWIQRSDSFHDAN